MNSDVDQIAALNLDRSSSSSETFHSDTHAAAATGDDGVAVDPDDEAIFNDFEATHLSGNRAATAAAAAAAAVPAASKQAHTQQQQQQQHAANGSSQQPSHHGYHRSKSSLFDGSSSTAPVSSSSGGRKGAGAPSVPGVAVARIEGCWLSHLNVDNKR
jgi:hypothetical protein